ncbi:MAG TPA: RNA polymerase sigma factor [Polyangia bacterium]|nr:RNA polymerase sigma factor [Polyangia bacterium]
MGPTDSSAALTELARRAVAGEKDATRTLLLAVGPPMVRAIRKLLAPRTPDVEDVAQEAMEAFLSALPSFRGECTLLHFACRVAVLTALANRRRLDLRAQYAADTFDVTLEQMGADAPSPAEALALRGRREALETLLDELPAAQAEVLVLHAVLGFTLEEVAAASAKPLETIRSRLRLGKQTLRQRIQANPGLSEILEVTS